MSLATKAPGYQLEWPTSPAGPPPPRPPALGFLHELPVLIVLALALAIVMKTFLVQAFYIPSGSMIPTLEVKDRVIVNKLAYRFREPMRGEVVVFIAEKDRSAKSLVQKVRSFLFEGIGVTAPEGETDYIKRVIGLPGETIEVTTDAVFITRVDGSRLRLKEPYTQVLGGQNHSLQSPLVVPDGHLFVMGDNRNSSSDSRVIGPIKRTDVIGKAFVRIWPPNRLGTFRVPSYARSGVRALSEVPTGAVVVGLPLGISLARLRRRSRGSDPSRASPPSGGSVLSRGSRSAA